MTERAEPVTQPAASEVYRCAALFFGVRGKDAHRTPWDRSKTKSRATSLPEGGLVLVLSTTEERKKDDDGKSEPAQDANGASGPHHCARPARLARMHRAAEQGRRHRTDLFRPAGDYQGLGNHHRNRGGRRNRRLVGKRLDW